MTVIPIHGRNPGPITGDGNWTWLVSGRVPTLVDAGTGAPEHLAAVDAALGSNRLAQVLVTHSHSDHAAGAPALAGRFPDARFLKMPWPERDANWPAAWQPIQDGAVLAAGDGSLLALHTPGHSPDHLAFWDAELRTLFCGDLAVLGSTVYIPPSLGGDLVAYLRSLERVLALNPLRMLPAHGPVIEDPVTLLHEYIAHRLEREHQVLDALASGARTLDEIVDRLYKGLDEQRRPFAAESVLAHLLKLENEARARREDARWLPMA